MNDIEEDMKMVNWKYYNKFEAINEKYLPATGEGDSMATQIVTAVNKLVYKWYNDGDVFDNTGALSGWANNLSSYANWLRKYGEAENLLDVIYDCYTDEDYEELLKDLADNFLDEEILAGYAEREKVDSIYKAEGPYRFEDCDEDEEEEW